MTPVKAFKIISPVISIQLPAAMRSASVLISPSHVPSFSHDGRFGLSGEAVADDVSDEPSDGVVADEVSDEPSDDVVADEVSDEPSDDVVADEASDEAVPDESSDESKQPTIKLRPTIKSNW